MAALVKIWVPRPGALRRRQRGRAPERPRRRPRGRGAARLHVVVHGGRALRRRRRSTTRGPTPGAFRNDYERTKALADARAREAAAAGQDVVILYPGVIYGPGDLTDGNIVAQHDRRPPERPPARPRGPRRPPLVVRLRRGRGRGPRRSRSSRGQPGERFVLGGENATLAELFALVQRDRRRASAAPAHPLRRRLRARAPAVALGRADRPPAAAHPRRGGRLPRGAGRTTAREPCARLGYAWRPLAEGLRETVALAARRGPRRRRPGERREPRPRRARAAGSSTSAASASRSLLRCLTWSQAALLALGGLPLQLAGPAADRRPGDVARRGRGAGLPGRASSPTRSPCSASSSSSATGCGWRPPAGASSRWATAWPRSSARRRAARACRGTTGRAGSASRPSSSSGPPPPPSSRPGWRGSPLDPGAAHWPRTAGIALALALACALVESLPTTLDDNVTVPLAVVLLLPLFAAGRPGILLGDPGLAGRVVAGLRGQRGDRARPPSSRGRSTPGALSRRS